MAKKTKFITLSVCSINHKINTFDERNTLSFPPEVIFVGINVNLRIDQVLGLPLSINDPLLSPHKQT